MVLLHSIFSEVSSLLVGFLVLTHSILSHLMLSDPILLSSPTLFILLSHLSCRSKSHVLQSYSIISSCPVLSHYVLSHLILSRGILPYLILSQLLRTWRYSKLWQLLQMNLNERGGAHEVTNTDAQMNHV